MARYPSSSHSKQMARRWIYIVSASLIAVAVIAFVYGRYSSGKNKGELIVTNVKNETIIPAAVRPAPELNLLEVSLPTTDEANPKVAEFIAEATAMINDRPARIIEARDRLNELLAIPMSRQQEEFVKNKLSELADKWLFSRMIFQQDELCGSYKVMPGNLLSTIG